MSSKVKAMVRVILLLVFVGWLMIWAMLPTKLYKNTWTPNLETKLGSTYFGGQGNICWAFLFPVTRGSSLLPLIGLTSESCIKYHIWLGHVSNILFAAHTIGFIIYWAITDQMAEILEWSKTWVSNVAGVIAIVIAVPIWVTSLPQFRRNKFELFFYTHHLYLVYIIFYVLHVGDAYSDPSRYLPFRSILRFLQSRQRTRLLSARVLPCGVVELNFSKTPGLYYNPTSILYVNVPGISKLQWHPFTVSSNCNMEDDKVSVVIKNSRVLVSQALPRDDRPRNAGASDSHLGHLRNIADSIAIQAYITREEEQPMTKPQKSVRTIWFKPDPSDSPIAATLGPNNWLWLGAIISTSFLMFLLLLGIVTPFVWCKKRNTSQGNRIQNTEVATPTTSSPGAPWFSCADDRELESLPHQHLAQATEIRFGSRPDFKKILFDLKESDVGVLACGPRKMRHDVAKICASGLAPNLHFDNEAVSRAALPWVHGAMVHDADQIVFSHWLPEIRSTQNRTYFGPQGSTMLIYTFPILFIAAMGCIYLHLGKKHGDGNFERRVQTSKFTNLKQPVLVKGPLGIVSWMELSFLTMFVVLLAWSTTSYLNNMFVHIDQMASKSGILVWEAKLEMSGLALGLVGNICLSFLFFPVTRGSSILQLMGLTSEAKQMTQVLKWDRIEVSNMAGEIALVSGLVMWVTSLPRIRRKMFELFYYTHHLYTLFVVFFVFHVGFAYSCIVLPGFYLFLVDRFLRFLQSQQRVGLVSARVLPCRTVELNFSKSTELSYTPTSILFVNVPGISKLQWHPFTITSSSNMDSDKLSIVIKSEGSWSSELYQKLSTPSSTDRVKVSVEGPYGPVSTHFLRHDTLVMLSGGSGITPFISIIRELMYKANNGGVKIPQILLICAFKKSVDLTMLELILPVSGATIDISCLQLQIEAYVTREKVPAEENHKPLKTIWFKPNALDAPVSAILGADTWLWLGLIISSSFVVFLLLIGILTQYYIYPIDHGTNAVYATAARAGFNMLFICLAIATTATTTHLWNKKRNRKGMRQTQNVDTPPTTSPTWCNNGGNRELESLPHQSLLQATKVHYGERPDLKRILFETKGSSVGVIVSGPRELRQEAAAICVTNKAKGNEKLGLRSGHQSQNHRLVPAANGDFAAAKQSTTPDHQQFYVNVVGERTLCAGEELQGSEVDVLDRDLTMWKIAGPIAFFPNNLSIRTSLIN
ncbi:Ferric reduction oxidase 3 [Hibiscus syriacus]|uniref:ferric-chelate reductase (NADH) n=1 Tax=Hibiscus syriacus TaxID=106335 RepID=A0A6A3BSV5_HIBSY|nr:Ferric reduction oxidase 3 [Hibiscus syriacus]